MPKKKRSSLTVGRIADFKAPETGQAFLWDATVPGLAVRATPGSKSFIFQNRTARKTVRITIGSCAVWKLGEAREEARRLQRLIDQGIDPRIDKQNRDTAGKMESMTVSEAFQVYLKAHRSQWSERTMSSSLYLSRDPQGETPGGVMWPLLQKRLIDINVHVLIQWAKDAAKAPSRSPTNQGRLTALRQGFIRFLAFWRWAYQREEYNGGMADPSILNHSDLRAMLPTAKPKNDVLEKGQLSAWFEAVTKIKNPIIAAYLQSLLLTGARRNELGNLKWEELNCNWKSMWVKDKVDTDGRKIPLTPYVEHLLSALPKRNEWVFSSPRSDSGRLIEPRIAHKDALVLAGIPRELSLHGLRRSFASLAEWVEMPVGIVAQIMGHKPSATAERHYKRRPLDLLALWHCKLETWILTEGGINFDPETVKKGLKVVG